MLPTDSQILERLRQKGSRILTFGQLRGAWNVSDEEAEAFEE